ncbi:MAG: hypothetical protein WC624_00610 [Candidatus Margulisiibacteriota bacterium]
MKKKIKLAAAILAIILPFALFGIGNCLSQLQCSCCPDQNGACWVDSDQNNLIAGQSERIDLAYPPTVSTSVKAKTIRQVYLLETLVFRPLGSSLQFKISHPQNGPPLA